VYLITCCPVYLPGNEHVLLSDFESRAQPSPDAHSVPLDQWEQSKQGVIWKPNSGFSGSACIKLTVYDDKEAYVQWTLPNPKDYQFLQLRAKMRTEGVVQGTDTWNKARLLVYFSDKDGKPYWDYHHVAAALTGTSPWKEFQEVFPVPEFAATATVVVQNSGRSGIVWCDDIALRPAYKNSSYFFLRGIVLVAGILLAISAIRLFGLLNNRGWISLGIIALILLGVLCSENLLEMIAGAFGFKVFLLKKFGHLILFFMLGLCSISWANARMNAPGRSTLSLRQLVLIFTGLLSFAVMTELLQFATLDRGPGKFDFIINMTGIIGGIAIAHFVNKLRVQGAEKS